MFINLDDTVTIGSYDEQQHLLNEIIKRKFNKWNDLSKNEINLVLSLALKADQHALVNKILDYCSVPDNLSFDQRLTYYQLLES